MNDLITAAQSNDIGRLRQLLENWDIAQDPSYFPSGSLHRACEAAARNNHPEAVEVLLDEGIEIERGIISAAARSGSIAVFGLFKDRGWDVNEPFGLPGDALIMAIHTGNLKLVEFLIASGADPNANLWMELFTPLECAVLISTSMMKVLVNAGAQVKGSSALTLAASHRKTEAISYLLDCGAPIDQVLDRMSALCIAATRGNIEVVKLLLEKGADVDVKAGDGKSACELAEANQHHVCARILRDASVGASGNGSDLTHRVCNFL